MVKTSSRPGRRDRFVPGFCRSLGAENQMGRDVPGFAHAAKRMRDKVLGSSKPTRMEGGPSEAVTFERSCRAELVQASPNACDMKESKAIPELDNRDAMEGG